MARFVLALDQGTTSSRAILFDEQGLPRSSVQHEFEQHYRQPGWVEHDAEEIFQSQLRAAREVLAAEGASAADVAAIGITNQRETTVVWDRRSGEAIHPAIVWQSRQTAGICQDLRERGLEEEFRARTGLVVDAYFSGTKLKFILDAVPGARERAGRGELAFGTIDSWLLFRLTEGRVHATEASNASRTLLYNIREQVWDDWLTETLEVPREVLPEVRDSSGTFGETTLLGEAIPITGMAGDQQSALFGQGCFSPGSAKNTYGTGCFFLVNTGEEAPRSETGLVTTIAWGLDGSVDYAIEGSVFVAGAAVQWLRDGLGLIQSAAETEAAAGSVADTDGVYLVPAFVGLGAPYWDERARGALVGLTRGTTREHVIRATLESMAYQSRDVIDSAARDSGLSLSKLRVDGGACQNDFLMQFQADILGIPVERPASLEVTAFGAAALAGLASGFWESRSELVGVTSEGTRWFEPAMSEDRRNALYHGWQRAVSRAKDWDQT